ncbi:serine protease [Trinickia terrae]|uniref:Serine protease n=1 Tax=Trinickia terrae TaxID=2571161 RepID=A0A4U1HMM6_9BURK|nr:S8 family serine peptidase [Trinickia terrae]TKC81318.1 serine protease [Trinickia terrae]
MTEISTVSEKREERAAKRGASARALLRWLAMCVCCATSACALVPAASNSAAMTQRVIAHPDRMIVLAVANPPETLMLRAGSTSHGYGAASGYATGDGARANVTALAEQYGLREVSAWPIPSLNVDCAMLEIVGDAPRETVVAKLAADPRVNLAEPLQTYHTLGDAPPKPTAYADLQQGLREIGADAAQKLARGDEVRIAVIDTGVDTTHPELRDRIANTHNFVDDDWDQFNRDRHGTEVAGIIAADRGSAASDQASGIEGVAPRAKIIALKACWEQDGNGRSAVCHTFTLAEALQAALEDHAQIVNLSLGGPPDPLLSELVALLVKKGVVVVGAVQPSGDMNAFPVNVPGVIAVASAGKSGDAAIEADARVLYAPGKNVLTLTPGGHYDFQSGSSFATAYVSGTAALLVGLQPRFNSYKVAALLDQTSGPTQWHARVINVCRAMATLSRPCVEAGR